MNTIEKATRWMENLAKDNSHGYDQIYRWGEKGDYDCSSAVITAWQNAGVPVKTNGATYTGNMYGIFLTLGFKDVTNKINLSTGTGLVRGDVLLNKKHHVAMYCGNGIEVEASINEKGSATGGTPGDQTGFEIRTRSYRNYPWDCILRYVKEDVPYINNTNVRVALEVIEGKWGNGDSRKTRLEYAGYNYDNIQKIVNMLVAGYSAYIDIAHDVIKGKYGVGSDRVDKLESLGYDASLVQGIVNCIMLYDLDI